jgi:REP element-mobilizing transposase RayT
MRISRQGTLRLRTKSTWGGRREGAGRKPGPNPRVRHLSRVRVDGRSPCHVTLRVRDGVPSLRNARFVAAFEESLRRGRERKKFRIVHYSIQRDHLHALVEAEGAAALGRGMKALGSRLAWTVRRVFGRTGRVLTDRYHLHVLRGPREVRNALAYVLLNAHKHAAALGRRVRPRWQVDPASSGRWFTGWRERVTPAPEAPAVSDARSWLLRTGWRRHGLLSVDEVPAASLAEARERGR